MANRSLAHVGSAAVLVALLTAGASVPLAAQHGGIFRGQVFDSAGSRLENVEVTLAEAHRATRTDSNGVFAFRAVPPGLYHVELRQPGYRPITGTARIAEGDSIDLRFRMGLLNPQLDTVHVSQTAVGDPLSDFKRRMAYGVGTFITRDKLEALSDWGLASVLRSQAGRIRIARLAGGGWTVARQAASGCSGGSCASDPACYLSVWVDGVRIYAPGFGKPPDLSNYRVQDLAGVEVYTGAAQTPLELNATGSSCGAIVFWTRLGPRAKRGSGGETRPPSSR